MPRVDVFGVHPRLRRKLATLCAVLATLTALALFVSASGAGAKAATGPKAYIGLFGDNSVAVFDSANNQVLTTIPVPTGPHGVVITPDNRRVYVSSDGASTVSMIDTMSDTVTSSIEVGQTPHGLAMSPDGSSVLVAGFGTNMVSAIDTATNKTTWSVPVTNPHNIAIAPDGQTAYVGSQDPISPSLVILSLPGHNAIASVPLDNVPRALTFSPDGTQLWFTEAGVDNVLVLDPTTNDIVATVPVGASPHFPAFTPDGALGMVVSQGPGELWLIDPATANSIGTVKVGDMPHWEAISADGLTAYVTNETSNDLSIVDLTTASVTDTIPVGAAPRQIALQTSVVVGAPQTTPSAPQPTPAAQPQPTTTLPAPVQSTTDVAISQFAFNPATVTIARGQSVTWTNNDPIQHTTTSDTPNWNSGALAPDATFSQTFSMPGTYTYHCNIHPFMHGTVIVTG